MNIDKATIENLKLITVDDNHTYMPQLQRPEYEKVNKVLELLGGKWSRSAKAHVFKDNPWDAIADAITAGAVVDEVKLFQFYPTPVNIAEMMVTLAEVTNQHVLEPSAGEGVIINALLRLCPSVAAVHYLELHEQRREVLHKLAKKHLPNFDIIDVGQDFLAADLPRKPLRSYDRIIANPPFAKGQDADHISRMLDLCTPGIGRIVTIAPFAWTYRKDRRYDTLRQRICEITKYKVLELHPKAFLESGTCVNVGILVMDML